MECEGEEHQSCASAHNYWVAEDCSFLHDHVRSGTFSIGCFDDIKTGFDEITRSFPIRSFGHHPCKGRILRKLLNCWLAACPHVFACRVFQHYRLFSNCFNRESLQWKYYEEVFIEVPENILYPLKDYDTMEEIDEDKVTKFHDTLKLNMLA